MNFDWEFSDLVSLFHIFAEALNVLTAEHQPNSFEKICQDKILDHLSTWLGKLEFAQKTANSPQLFEAKYIQAKT